MYQVLLVDDEPAALSMVKRAISKSTQNYEVVGEAYDVEQGIRLFKELKPDVIITDMKMPKKSGIELIRYITEQEEKSTICIALSGYSDFDYVHGAFTYGAFDYLLKPIDSQKLKDLFIRMDKTLDKNKKTRVKLAPTKLSSEKLVEKITDYIEQNLREDNSILTICNKFYISQPYLSKIFKQHKNCTYNDYLTSIRVQEAKKLLKRKEEFRIGEIAESLGFSDQFYFSKVFKVATGYTPREYRNQNLEE
ncbi:hypothetical protein CS063_11610 [Sporanaerobium hydrogeniformans]|uniref:Uncharacterized protein n=1 Tax=Sporanaerobium hydrogeniformans TaxID=3072179 RepID=A0AC61DB78_9FIRM|nr:response regulator [Sporanaerobium hydrogeniformans]PHV70308.1 hypothetical protein CS063_11610 [Sporanaerobium hydrogeniformans]